MFTGKGGRETGHPFLLQKMGWVESAVIQSILGVLAETEIKPQGLKPRFWDKS